jgi:hypothetical protein
VVLTVLQMGEMGRRKCTRRGGKQGRGREKQTEHQTGEQEKGWAREQERNAAKLYLPIFTTPKTRA